MRTAAMMLEASVMPPRWPPAPMRSRTGAPDSRNAAPLHFRDLLVDGWHDYPLRTDRRRALDHLGCHVARDIRDS
jgi:hypothetical protein